VRPNRRQPASLSSDYLIEIDHVTFGYDSSRTILNDVTLNFPRGKVTAILGGSGCGKTTLLRLIGGMYPVTRGAVRFDGEVVNVQDKERLFRLRRRLGMLFQFGALFTDLSVFDNVAFPLREHRGKLSKAELKDKVQQALEALGVGHAVHKLPSELSGGMRKRVAVARALVMEPEILIYDEPTTGLDPITSRTVDELIESTRERFGVTSVVISHDMESVFTGGHFVTLLYKGKIEVSAPRDEFVASDNPRVREFLKASGVKIAT
jgi:phospholipid/cholesterol/gamma-HCH transport system ATP-binding protein